MYQGNNPIALQSQNMIINALLTLMKKKDFSKINIKELCEKAMISRQTFYTLFESKEEVIELYLDTLFKKYIEKYMTDKRNYELKELCDNTISYLIENKEMIHIILKNNLDHIVKTNLEHHLLSLDNLLHTSERQNQEYAIVFLAGGLMGVISYAVKNQDFEDGSKISLLIENIITGEYFRP